MTTVKPVVPRTMAKTTCLTIGHDQPLARLEARRCLDEGLSRQGQENLSTRD